MTKVLLACVYGDHIDLEEIHVLDEAGAALFRAGWESLSAIAGGSTECACLFTLPDELREIRESREDGQITDEDFEKITSACQTAGLEAP